MTRATKVFEAHLHTVQLANDPLMMEFHNALAPLINESKAPVAIMEAEGNLSWEQIQKLFKAAEKVAKDTQPSTIEKAHNAIATTAQKFKRNMRGPVPNATDKIQKLYNRAKNVLANVPGSESLQKRLQKAVKHTDKTEPKLVLAALSTVIAHADDPKAIPPLMDMIATLDEDEHIENFGPANKDEDPFVEPKEDPEMDNYDMGRAALRNASQVLSSKKADKFVKALSNVLDKAEENERLALAIRPHLETIAFAKTPAEINAAIKAVRNTPVTESAVLKQILGWG